MLYRADQLRKFKIHATDGDLGSVQDFLFDDREWIVRYIVIDAGNWLVGRQVLISPAAIGDVDAGARRVNVLLDRERIRGGPGLEQNQPVSRQYEDRLTQYYGWPVYWGAYGLATEPVYPTRGVAAEAEQASRPGGPGDPHLRSMKEVIGYRIEARDGAIGHVEDFLVEDEGWRVPYLIVNTRNWLPGKKVLVSPSWVNEVSWPEALVRIDLARDVIRNSPEFKHAEPLTREYEARLHEHYGRPAYWEQPAETPEK
jgi:uncharacterized protein YrrD